MQAVEWITSSASIDVEWISLTFDYSTTRRGVTDDDNDDDINDYDADDDNYLIIDMLERPGRE